MKRYSKIRRIVRVEFTTEEFVECVSAIQSVMHQLGTRDPRKRLEVVGAYFRDEEKGMAFEIRMQLMKEMMATPNAKEFSSIDPQTRVGTVSVGAYHAAALAPIHYDDENQFFKPEEFWEIAGLERKALIAAEVK